MDFLDKISQNEEIVMNDRIKQTFEDFYEKIPINDLLRYNFI
jgi:hypothetical protein